MEIEKQQQTQEQVCDTSNTQVAVVENTPRNAVTMWEDTELFNQTFKMAKILSSSSLIPQAYQDKPNECIVAIDMARRMNLSPMAVMQYSQVVKGNFTWKGTACKAMIDGCGKYAYSEYVEVGTPNTDSYGIYLQALEKRTGRMVKGATVTMRMATLEDWTRNPKWKSMPELMLRYRASAFFMRTECPNLAMGFLTSEEQEDISYDTVDTMTTDDFTQMINESIGE